LVGVPLGLVAAVLARTSLVVGVDSGILHLATAAGAPTVRLVGPVDPGRFGPWGDPALHRTVRADPPCVACNRLDYAGEELALHPCIRAISVEAVLAAARSSIRTAALA
jgi:heptosyltransferase-2/heptosyltransferase-3